MSDTSTEKNNPPVHKIISRNNLITVDVWQKDTEYGPRHNITRNRRYQDKDGNWHDTQSIFEDDIPEVCVMEGEAFAWIRERRRANAQARKEQAKQTEAA